MRVPVIVGVIGGVGAGKEAFSKTVQKHLSDKFKLTTYIVHENAKADQSVLSDERVHEQAMDSMYADVVMVNGSSLLHNEKLRSQMDFKVFLHSDSDHRLANYVKNAKGRVATEQAMDKYFTEVRPKDLATLDSGKHADFLAHNEMGQDKMNLLGLMISDMCCKGDMGSMSGVQDSS